MSENRYLVAARKYRPQRFGEIVAQEHVTETLQNAIRLDRLAHAYLFSGPRGVGKTTAARILAKAINCTTPLENRDQGEPCRECESCITFEQSRSLSILEIDAASNNRVEDIRELRDTILIPPQGSKKKVYIIDEVHMLSNAAFNALLKTLEEPPPHALFIFATTEPNKVLPTILSRCQRFDFRRIAVPEIVKHLRAICEEEDIRADEASLMLIAHKGDGALRDSLSAFDQAVSLCGTSLVYDELAKAFGVVGIDLFFEVTDCVKEGNSAGLLMIVDRILGQGYDLQEFLVGLANHLRNLLVASTMPDTSLIEAAESVKKKYANASSFFSEPDLLRLLMITADGEQQLKTSVQPRLQMELSLLKMASMAHAVDLREALKKLDMLEKQGFVSSSSMPHGSEPQVSISEHHAPAPSATEVPTASRASATALDAPKPDAPVVSSAPITPLSSSSGMHARSAVSASNLAVMSIAPDVEPSSTEVLPVVEPIPLPPLVEEETIEEETETTNETPANQASLFSLAPPSTKSAPETESRNAAGYAQLTHREAIHPKPETQHLERFFGTPALKKVPRQDDTQDETVAVVAEEIPAVTEGSAVEEVEWIKGSWTDYSLKIKQDKIHVSALLQHTVPVDIRDATLVLSVPDEFHKRMLGSQSEYLLDVLKEFVALDVHRISFIVDLARAEEKAAAETAKEVDPYEYMQKKRQENPVIKAIFDEFGGEMVW